MKLFCQQLPLGIVAMAFLLLYTGMHVNIWADGMSITFEASLVLLFKEFQSYPLIVNLTI